MIRVRDSKGRIVKNNDIYNYTKEKDDDLSLTGIYIINNKIDNRVYVGSTSVYFLMRWYEHLRDLKENKHHCIHLQNFVNKYGLNTIEFKILEIYKDKETLKDREKYWIDFYGFDNCFNVLNETRFSEIKGEKNYKYLKINIDFIKTLFFNGNKIKEISKISGFSETKIKNTLYKNGIDSVRYSNNLPLTELYFRNMLGKETLRNLAKEVGVDVWVLRYRLREAGFPSRDSLIKEYFKRFLKVKENIKEWCNKIPFDYCTFNTMKKTYEKK